MPQYIFIVDTDTYAGNFERELTAFVTGVIGDCGKGEEEAAMFKAKYPARVEEFEAMMTQVPDDHGCNRPTTIWETPGMMNDGMGNEYPADQAGSPEVIERYRQSKLKYAKENPGAFGDEDLEKLSH